MSRQEAGLASGSASADGLQGAQPQAPGRVRRFTRVILLALALLMLLLAGGFGTFLATERGSRFLVNLATDQVNGIEDLDISIGSSSGNLLRGLQLRDIDFTGAGVEVDVTRLSVAWDPLSLFTGELLLRSLQAEQVTVTRLEADAEPLQSDNSNFIADFTYTPLPVVITVADFDVRDLALQLGGQSAVVNRLSARIELDETELSMGDVFLEAEDAELAGSLSSSLVSGIPVRSELDWRFDGSLPLDYASASGRLQLEGSLDSLSVSHSLQDPVEVETTGHIEGMAGASPELELRHRSSLVEIELPDMPLRLENFGLTTSGSFSEIHLTLSSDMRIGDLPDAEVDLAARLDGGGIEVSRGALSTETGSLEFSSAVSWADGLTATGRLRVNEADPLAYIPLEAPIPVNQLAGRLSYEASLQQDSRQLTVVLEGLGALVDGQEVAASGLLELVDNRLQINELQLQSSANRLLITGDYGEDIELQWRVDVPALEQFVPGLSGRVEGSGFISGDPEEPDIAGELTLQSLSSGEFRLGVLDLQVQGTEGDYALDLALRDGWLGSSPVDAIHSLDASLRGSAEGHELLADLLTERGSVSLQLDGAFEDLETLDWRGSLNRASLAGDVGDWQLTKAVQLAWQNGQARMDQGCWLLDSTRLCVAVSPGSGAVYSISGELQDLPLSEFNSGPEHLLEIDYIPRLPREVLLSGTMDANFSAELEPGRSPQVDFEASARSPSLTLRSLATDDFGAPTTEAEILEQTYIWRELNMAGNLDAGAWQFDASASLDQRRVQDTVSEINGALSARLAVGSGGELSGTGSASFDELGWAAAFIPDVSSVTGSLRSRLNLSGTSEAPQLTGELSVINGSVLVDRTGVLFEDLAVNFVSTTPEQAVLDGRIATDSGFANFDGVIEQFNTPDWRVAARLSGENLLLSDLPELKLRVTPEIDLEVNRRQISLSGDLRLPTLNLVLRELPESAVDISRDVVITNFPEDRPELQRSFTSGQTSVMNLPVVLDVNLMLGENISLEGFGLKAELAGSLAIQQTYGGTNLTYGELSVVEGDYEIYGQTLNLREGELLFLGNYNNPALNIRAVREVRETTVGVLMNGTLDNIRSELFSTPTLPESDIISVLVTGRPVAELRSGEETSVLGAITTLGLRQSESISQQIGQRLGLDTLAITSAGDVDSSELTVGKYLTPNLFIRYGVGLFDNESKVAVDYNINERLTLHAESGEYQSLDVTYKVER